MFTLKKLFIAEKPDIGKTIANYLWEPGSYQRDNGFMRRQDVTVTWAFGHILGLAEPEAYGEEYKAWKNYPIIPGPEQWILSPSAATAKQLAIIKKLLAETDVVVHAGDPDREGQLLIDEILTYCNFQGEVQRILINAKDDESMKRAFDQITDNEKYKNLYAAGLAREQADWLVGMNLSRAYTVNARNFGYTSTFRIGRVKVPTLALVVNREKEIKNFKPTKHFTLKGTFEKDSIPFTATLKPSEKLPVDEENRIMDKKLLQAIKLKIEKSPVIVTDIQEKDQVQNPPLPHSLDTLQVEANKKFGLSPKDVLDTVQSLYEKKFVSYPRSDCNYIPASQKEDFSKIMPVLLAMDLPGAAAADFSMASKAFNDSKITAHHAIIPTGVAPADLASNEKTLYELIANRYILQFLPPYKFKKTTFALSAADEFFTGSGSVVIDMGFKAAFHDDEASAQDEDNSKLPPLAIDEQLSTADYAIINKTTTAPKRFTEGTLLAAMTNIWRFVDAKNPNREKLKDVKGIGTPATRDTIIAELLQDKIKGKDVDPCIKKVKKELVPTPFGINFIENIDPVLTLPDTTAVMEYSLSEISEGQKSAIGYIDEVITLLHESIKHAETHKFPMANKENAISCPICENGTLIRKYSPKIDKHFHICSNPDCVSPDTGKKVFYEDNKGKPVIAKCPSCQHLLIRLKGKNGFFWACSNSTCKQTFNEKNHQPDIKEKSK